MRSRRSKPLAKRAMCGFSATIGLFGVMREITNTLRPAYEASVRRISHFFQLYNS